MIAKKKSNTVISYKRRENEKKVSGKHKRLCRTFSQKGPPPGIISAFKDQKQGYGQQHKIPTEKGEAYLSAGTGIETSAMMVQAAPQIYAHGHDKNEQEPGKQEG